MTEKERKKAVVVIGKLHRRREAMLRARIVLSNQAGSFVRRPLGWRWDMKEGERAKLCRTATKLVKAIETGKPVPEGTEAVAKAVAIDVLILAEARRPIETCLNGIEKEMVRAAKELPVWESFVADCAGLGPMGLAQIVAEADDLAGYADVGRLWKRLGLAVIAGKAQGRRTDPEEAAANGFNPRRRCIMYRLGEAIIKVGGPLKKVYDARKKYEHKRDPKMTKMHAHRRAKRYMEKRLVKQLWRAWTAKAGAKTELAAG